jgi:hypothetical protein
LVRDELELKTPGKRQHAGLVDYMEASGHMFNCEFTTDMTSRDITRYVENIFAGVRQGQGLPSAWVFVKKSPLTGALSAKFTYEPWNMTLNNLATHFAEDPFVFVAPATFKEKAQDDVGFREGIAKAMAYHPLTWRREPRIRQVDEIDIDDLVGEDKETGEAAVEEPVVVSDCIGCGINLPYERLSRHYGECLKYKRMQKPKPAPWKGKHKAVSVSSASVHEDIFDQDGQGESPKARPTLIGWESYSESESDDTPGESLSV